MSIDLSLDRIRVLVSHLPPYTRPTCHIAGTNGKGSVAALVSAILLASSPPLSVGRFNSPHLVTIYDCITLNDKPVSPTEYAPARETVERANREHEVGASSFELLTCTALFLFERAKVDIVVLEVGMGGRLDATNVIPDDCVLVSALTAVDLDHQAFLGNTVALIAKEKAGIARRGRPFLVGPQKHPEVRMAVDGVVSTVGGFVVTAEAAVHLKEEPVVRLNFKSDTIATASYLPPPPQAVTVMVPALHEDVNAILPLHGAHQLENLGIAAGIVSAMLEHSPENYSTILHLKTRITGETIAQGIQNVRWPGRLSYCSLILPISPSDPSSNVSARQLFILADGAHNPASSVTLAQHISDVIVKASVGRRDMGTDISRTFSLTYILALSHSPPKTPYDTFSPLLPLPSAKVPGLDVDVAVAVLRFTPPEGMPWVKSVPPSELKRTIQGLASNVDVWAVPDDEAPGASQLQRALEWAAARTCGVGLDNDALVVVAGSLYLVADLYRLPWIASVRQVRVHCLIHYSITTQMANSELYFWSKA